MVDDGPAAAAVWRSDPSPLQLACGVQHYDWGERGPDALIPRLFGASPAATPDAPYAELWIGAHPALPATVALPGADATMTLMELITRAPQEALGAASVERFGPELPFLAKVLTAERPLSIQAHPDRAQAQAGFAREDAAGIPRDAPGRSYRDRNHKPELILALGEFFALKGFRPVAEIAALFATVPELAALAAGPPPRVATDAPDRAPEREWLRRLFERCMSPDDGQAERALVALVDRLERQAGTGGAPVPPPMRDEPAYWLVRTARRLARGGPPDRGLFAFYLLNLVHLRAGEALFLRAGEPHAYLEGRGLEVMANSDNVLRGGLTPKHVDLGELLRVLMFDGEPALPVRPDPTGRYPAPVQEFAARMVALGPGGAPADLAAGSATVLLVLEGAAVLEAGAHQVAIARGEAWFVPAAIASCRLRASSESARVFAVTVPT